MKKLLLFLALTCGLHASYLPSQQGALALKFTGAAISTSTTGDLVTVATGLARYVISAVYVETTAASGSLALGTVDVRTATSGGGSSVLAAPTALVGLTAVDLAMSVTPMTLGAIQTAANLTLRQTVISANAGTISVIVILIPVP